MEQTKDILKQEPEAQHVECMDDADGYVVYINLDYLNMIFESSGITGDNEAQHKYINELQENIQEVLSRQSEKNLILSWLWADKDGRTYHAIEVLPIKKAQGVQIVTPDINSYNELNDKIETLCRIIDEQRRIIENLNDKVYQLNKRIVSNILDSCNPADWR